MKEVAEKVRSRTGKAWFMTALGTNHASCTDAPLIVPWALRRVGGGSLPVREGIMQCVRRTIEFADLALAGKVAGLLGKSATHPEYVREDPRQGRTELDSMWQIHVAPQSA